MGRPGPPWTWSTWSPGPELASWRSSERVSRAVTGSTWAAAGIAGYQFDVNQWCLELGGHCRTGLEDNIKFDRDRLAVSNAELVTKIVDIAGDFGRRPATSKEAREILGLAGAD